MSKAIVHIGFNKCGSTAIQKWLSTHVSDLAEHGFAYRRTDPRGHVICTNPQFADLAFSLNGETAPNRGMTQVLGYEHGNLDSQNDAMFRFAEDYAAWVRDADQPVTLISNEFLASWLSTTKRVRAFDDWLLSVFDAVEYVVYVRDPLSWFISSYGQQKKRGGGVGDFAQYMAQKKSLDAPFAKQLKIWATVVSEQRLNVRLYQETWRKTRGLTDDYAEAIGLAQGAIAPSDLRANASFTTRGGAPLAKLKAMVTGRTQIERPTPSSRLIEDINAACASGLDWLEDTFFASKRDQFQNWRAASPYNSNEREAYGSSH